MKMNLLKKALIPAVVALSVLAPLSAFAADTASATDAGGAGSSIVQPAQGKWQRLKESIADQRQDRGQDRRESLRRRLARSVGPHRVMYMELLSEKYLPSEETDWEQAFADRKQVLEELKQQHQRQGRGDSGGQQTASQADREARRALYEQFTKAVADQNADEIAAVLPKLLAQYEHDTDVLRQRVQPQPQSQAQS